MAARAAGGVRAVGDLGGRPHVLHGVRARRRRQEPLDRRRTLPFTFCPSFPPLPSPQIPTSFPPQSHTHKPKSRVESNRIGQRGTRTAFGLCSGANNITIKYFSQPPARFCPPRHLFSSTHNECAYSYAYTHILYTVLYLRLRDRSAKYITIELCAKSYYYSSHSSYCL